MADPTYTLKSLIAVAFVVALLGGPASPAAAHDGLLSSTPDGGETLAEAPSMVMLTFSGEILAGSDTAVVIEVTDPAGTLVSEGNPVVDGVTVTQQLTPDVPAGDYTVTWRVVSSDGHPISSDFHFFIAEPGELVDPAVPSESEATPQGPTDTTSEATPNPTAEPSPSATASASDVVTGGGATFPILLVGGFVLVVAVLLVAVLRLGQKRRTQDARDAETKEHTDDA